MVQSKKPRYTSDTGDSLSANDMKASGSAFEVEVFLAGSTNRRYYVPAFAMLSSIADSLESEWAQRVRPTGRVLPRLSVQSADSSMEQETLSRSIRNADVVLFFLGASDEIGGKLREELEMALGSFLRKGKPYP